MRTRTSEVSHQIEDLLEAFWMLREEGRECSLEHLRERVEDDVEVAMEEAERSGLLQWEDGELSLTPQGEAGAETVIRRHRLAEVLLREVLDLSEEQMETTACQFEHILSPEVTESICTLLGHPLSCPHGRPIPPGECCTASRRDVRPLVVPVSELETGAEGRIAFLAPGSHARLDRLAVLGLVPGNTIRLHQRHPAYVVQVGETELALDSDIAEGIYVRRAQERRRKGATGPRRVRRHRRWPWAWRGCGRGRHH